MNKKYREIRREEEVYRLSLTNKYYMYERFKKHPTSICETECRAKNLSKELKL